MDRTWLAIIAGSVGLLAAVVLLRRGHSDVPNEDEGLNPRAERSGTDSSARSRRARGPASARDDDDDRREEINGRIGIADKMARARARGAQAGRTDTGVADEPNEQTASGGGADAREKVGTGPTPAGGAQGSANGTAAPSGSQKDGGKDDDGLALSLKFDKSTLPEKGDTAPVVEHGITFDDQGAHFAADAQFAIPNAGNASGAAGTISFWLVPEWVGETDTNASLVQLRTNTFENRIQIFKNGPYLRFIFCDNTGVESGVGVSVTDWQPKVGHMVTATWGDGVTSLYVDGQSVGSKEYNGELQVGPDTPLLIGSDHADGAPGARSAISDFKIYTRALSPDEVAALSAHSRR